MKNLEVKTPQGTIIAKAHNEFPGISIQIDEFLPVLYLEYDYIEKCFSISSYICDGEVCDDPVTIIKFNINKENI